MVEDFNTPLSSISRVFIEKLKKEVMELTDIMNQMDLRDTQRIFHPKTKEYTFFSAHHGSFSKTDHILGYKASLT